MRVVRIEGRDLELIQALLGELATSEIYYLEVAVDSEGFKVKHFGQWTPGYGTLQPAPRRYKVTDDLPTLDELLARADNIIETEEGRSGRGTD